MTDNEIPSLVDAMRGLIDVLDQPAVEAPVAVGERWPVTRTGERQPIAKDLRRIVWTRDDGRCAFCGWRKELMELDHIVPWSAGGPDVSTNLRILCHDCNASRSNRRTEWDRFTLRCARSCDRCEARWSGEMPAQSVNRPAVTVFCGDCRKVSTNSDPGKLL
jgi:hypothetical protein